MKDSEAITYGRMVFSLLGQLTPMHCNGYSDPPSEQLENNRNLLLILCC